MLAVFGRSSAAAEMAEELRHTRNAHVDELSRIGSTSSQTALLDASEAFSVRVNSA
jgi:hypothetical protein